jgi:cytochrome c biogenesis protein
LTLLCGLTISSWTGFSGFKPAIPGESFSLADAQHSHLWIGSLPKWLVKINDTRREDYPSGEVKQWYSNISIVDNADHVLKNQTISVNDPLTYNGVDIYQSSWSLKSLKLSFNDRTEELPLQSMGKLFAAFLPLPDQSIIIFSVRDQKSPLRIFAKRKDWDAPKLISEVFINQGIALGDVFISYKGTVAQTGLQYKCDPGFPPVCFAFILIIAGISLAAIPHRQVWAFIQSNDAKLSTIYIGGSTKKGKQSFAKQIDNLIAEMQKNESQANVYKILEKTVNEEIGLSINAKHV